MYNIKQTEIFSKWLHKLKDIKAKVAILRRIERMRHGHFGDVKAVGDDVSEMRLDISADTVSILQNIMMKLYFY